MEKQAIISLCVQLISGLTELLRVQDKLTAEALDKARTREEASEKTIARLQETVAELRRELQEFETTRDCALAERDVLREALDKLEEPHTPDPGGLY